MIDYFSEYARTNLKYKCAQAITDAFSQITKTSKRKPNLLETDDRKEYVKKFFNGFLKENNILARLQEEQ